MLLPGLFVFQVLCFVNAYPNGAPMGACEVMLPRHSGVLPQPSPAPYTLLTNSRTFQPGKPITVTITGSEYRGVLLGARRDGSTNVLGSWQHPPPDTRFMRESTKCRDSFQHQSERQHHSVQLNTTQQAQSSSWKPEGLDLATDVSAAVTEEKHLLLFVICFLMSQVLG